MSEKESRMTPDLDVLAREVQEEEVGALRPAGKTEEDGPAAASNMIVELIHEVDETVQLEALLILLKRRGKRTDASEETD